MVQIQIVEFHDEIEEHIYYYGKLTDKETSTISPYYISIVIYFRVKKKKKILKKYNIQILNIKNIHIVGS